MSTGRSSHTISHDINDANYDAFLANDRTLSDPKIYKIENNTKVLLPIINDAVMSVFLTDPGELTGKLNVIDGQNIEPLDIKNISNCRWTKTGFFNEYTRL